MDKVAYQAVEKEFDERVVDIARCSEGCEKVVGNSTSASRS